MSKRTARKRVNRKSDTSGSEEQLRLTLARADPKWIQAGFKLPLRVEMPVGLVGIPDSIRVALKYSQVVNFTASAAPAGQVFQINSLFDPDSSGTGHQPSFYDFWKLTYSRYCVLGFSAIATIENETTGVGVSCACVYADSDVSGQSVESLTEANRSKTTVVGPAGTMNVKTLRMPPVTIAQVMGQKWIEPDSNMYAITTALPTDGAYMIFKCAATDASTSVTVRVKFTLLYDAIFKDVNPLYPS